MTLSAIVDRLRRWYETPGLPVAAVTLAAATLALADINPLAGWELKWLDGVQRLRFRWGMAHAVATNQILHLDITDGDLAGLPDFESEYEAFRTIIRSAREMGAAAIAFDIIFNRGSRESQERLIDEVAGDPRVIFAQATVPSIDPTQGQEPKMLHSFPDAKDFIPTSGLVDIIPDPDGVHRRYALFKRVGDTNLPSLALATYMTACAISWDQVRWDESSRQISWIEPDADGAMRTRSLPERPVLLDYRSGWTSEGPAAIPHLTLSRFVAHADTSHQRAGEELGAQYALAGRALIVSHAGTGIADLGPTPFGGTQPLAHLHAMALNGLFQDTFIKPSPKWINLLWVALMAAGFLLAGRGRSLPSLLILSIGGIAGTLATAAAAVIVLRWFPPGVLLTATWACLSGFELSRRYTRELVERTRLSSVMGVYFSPRVIRRVLQDEGAIRPQRADLTVLLSDLRNFTHISERFGPETTFALLNKHFSVQIKAAMDEDGNLEHFFGDQFTAYWGAPEPQPDGADRAIRAALASAHGLEALRATLDPKIQEHYGYGISIHAGPAIVGNVGSKRQVNYMILGDTVNAAARVESLTKLYRVPILLTQNVVDRLTDRPPLRLIDRVTVKGRLSSLSLYEVARPQDPAHRQTTWDEYHVALGLYFGGDFRAARRRFQQLHKECDDGPSHALAERCLALEANPPENWDGAFVLQSK